MTLSNFDIEELSKRLNIKIVGCFLKNELPEKCKNGNYIINMDSSYSGKNGTHWTLLMCRESICLYFDSFGIPPPKEVLTFIRQKYKQHYWNNEIIQNIKSQLCGYFCLALIKYVKNSKDMLMSSQNFINMFDDNTKLNDNILKKYINPKI